MRVGVFYVSPNWSADRQAVRMSDGTEMFVRTEVMEVDSEEDGLDKADIRPDEALMNAHSLEKEDYEE